MSLIATWQHTSSPHSNAIVDEYTKRQGLHGIGFQPIDTEKDMLEAYPRFETSSFPININLTPRHSLRHLRVAFGAGYGYSTQSYSDQMGNEPTVVFDFGQVYLTFNLLMKIGNGTQ